MEGFAMEASNVTKGMRFRSRKGMAMALAAIVLATAGLARGDADHNLFPARVKRKDHAVRDAINRMAYAVPYEMTLVSTCDCLEPTCEGGFMLSCGGEIDPPYAGFLSASRRTSRETCYVCGCAEYATLRATPVCID
jgi:hypothetical protein